MLLKHRYYYDYPELFKYLKEQKTVIFVKREEVKTIRALIHWLEGAYLGVVREEDRDEAEITGEMSGMLVRFGRYP